ncbi:protein REPRESSOR OF SILENCING 3 [Lycium ferocissimum]|uniref:protein REPRESSOR OF SILENCING 3 n=1 Tax=Lycium ferocissimum TaxID=112874 RepID=UPI002815401F|nr:protein REPRESSOR OF SILENCING 3 [Lycium ferocissimum]
MAAPADMAKVEGCDTSMANTVRIYIGGLGESVTADDLKKTFSTPQLGKVESMDIVRTKGRSFAYLDLLPSSEKSLPKLFSTYNGCMWKGGRLRIEKAKEHFFLRLKREWEEDATLATTSTHPPVTAAEMTNSLKSQKKNWKLDETQIRIYFPKLGKIKSVPLRGTGKHKYSFQRVEVPSLPTHFCDCEEHSGPPYTTNQKSLCNYGSKDGGMDEKELNIMNSVLNRIFERENYSEQAPRDFKLSKEARNSNGTVDHLQNEKNLVNQVTGDDDNLTLNVVAGASERTTMVKDPIQEAMAATQVNEDFVDQEMDDDDDNLIINVVAGANDKNTMFKDPTQEAIAALQNSLSKESRLATDKEKQGRKMSSNRKRKAPSDDDGEGHTLLPEAKQNLNALTCDRTDVCPAEVKPGSQPSNRSAKFPKKSPWKDLVSASSGATFSLLDILPSAIPGKEMQSGPKGVSESYFTDKKDEVSKDEKVSDQHEELDKVESEDEVSEDEKVSDQHEELDNFESEDEVSDQHEELDNVESEDEVSEDEKVSDQHEEDKVESEDELSKDEKVSDQHEQLDKIAEDPIDNLDGPVDIYARGAAWRKQSSWTQLVSDTARNSFSISQILYGRSNPEPELPVMGETGKAQKSNSTDKCDFQDVSTSHEGTKADAFSALVTCSASVIVGEQKNVPFSQDLPVLDNYQQKGKKKNEACASTPEKEPLSSPKQAILGDPNYSETCSFMRSAASMKEWTKTKAALSGSLKKKTNEKK